MSYNVNILGHCSIVDDQNNIILNQTNDIHPANMARVIARGLAGESNHWISSLKLGDMGSYPTADGIIHRSPNDGLAPDYTGWQSSLYNQTYSKYIDNDNLTINSVESSNSNFGLQLNDPLFDKNISTTNNSSVVINLLLNSDEPNHQQDGGVYVFDELALYSGITTDRQYSKHTVLMNKSFDMFNAGVVNNHKYELDIKINNVIHSYIIITSRYGTGINYQYTYHDLIESINEVIYDTTFYITAFLDEYYESIIFSSSNSLIEIMPSTSNNWLFNNINFNGFEQLINSTYIISDLEKYQTYKNNILEPLKEAPRLLTHMTFDPIRKPAKSNYYFTYTIDILVDRTDPVSNDRTIPDDYRVTSPFIFNAIYSSTQWVVSHNLGYYPKIKVFINDILYTNYQTSYLTTDTIILVFATPQKGVAKIE